MDMQAGLGAAVAMAFSPQPPHVPAVRGGPCATRTARLATHGETGTLHAASKHTTCCTTARREQTVPKAKPECTHHGCIRTLLAHLGLDQGKLLLRHSWGGQHLHCQVHDLGHILPESLEACAQAHIVCKLAIGQHGTGRLPQGLGLQGAAASLSGTVTMSLVQIYCPGKRAARQLFQLRLSHCWQRLIRPAGC